MSRKAIGPYMMDLLSSAASQGSNTHSGSYSIPLDATLGGNRRRRFSCTGVAEFRKYIRSIVYGGTDGIITIFAVVAGVSGASLSSGILLILGVATLFADALSMSVSDYLSSTADEEKEQVQRTALVKEYDCNLYDVERQLRRIFRNKGFSSEEVEVLTRIISKNRDLSVDLLSLDAEGEDSGHQPHVSAIYTFVSFVFFGFIPLLLYIVLLPGGAATVASGVDSSGEPLLSLVTGSSSSASSTSGGSDFSAEVPLPPPQTTAPFTSTVDGAFWTGTCLTLCALFALGLLKGKLTGGRSAAGLGTWWSGMQMVSVGGAAAFIAYLIAYFMAALEGFAKQGVL